MARTAKLAIDKLTEKQIRSMTPLDVMVFAMQHGLRVGALKTAAFFAEKAAPFVHAKPAPDGPGSGQTEIVVRGGLPD